MSNAWSDGDLERVDHMIMLTGYVNVAPGFDRLPAVIDGASDLIVKIWGDRGEHTRAAIGVAALGDNAPVETTLIVRVNRLSNCRSEPAVT